MKKTIMIVDDMKLNIEILANQLDAKYTIIPAISGEMAIKLMERRRPDLVLLDVYMPGIDGFGVLHYMKQQPELAAIPVIFVTGELDEDTEAQGLALGAVDYVKKPYNVDIVSVKVQNHLELKAYRDDLEFMVLERTELLEERTHQLDASREAIIMGMSLMSESHDKVTGDHILRIKNSTRLITDKMLEMYPGLLTPELAGQIVLFSPLHDVGKVCISDTILKKTGLLTADEFLTMQSHTLEGGALLRKTESFLVDYRDGNDLAIAIEIAEGHHERYDGSGYPYKLRGEEIPLSARIVAVADVYDALRSPRPYKSAFTHQQSVDIIMKEENNDTKQHFDPKVLDAFLAVEDQFKHLQFTE